MSTETVTKKLFNLDEFQHILDAEIFPPDTFFELIRGEIIEMADPTGPHIGRVNKLNRLFTSALGERVILNISENVLEVRTDPADGQYRRTEIFKPGQTVSPQELPGVTFAVDDILK